MAHTLREMLDKLMLRYNKELNPKLWVNGDLKPEITDKLLKIADAWREFAKIPDSAVEDIIITGGNVNYNYTDVSDIDLHLVCDMTKMPVRNEEIMTDIIFSKKALWAAKHPGISIYGYPVELFAQDVNKPFPVQQGVYSIITNSWLVQPENLNLDFDSDFGLKSKVESHMRAIDRMLTDGTPVEQIKDHMTKLHAGRGEAIQAGGEFAFENLVYKELRNRGYLAKMSNHIQQHYDDDLSLR